MTPPTWRRPQRKIGGSRRRSASSSFIALLRLMCLPAGVSCAGVCSERRVRVSEGDVRATCGFRCVAGALHGVASETAGKRGLDEHRMVTVELKICILCRASPSSPIQVAASTTETHPNPTTVPAASPPHAFISGPAHTQAKARHRQLTKHQKVELESRWKAFRNACRRPKHHRVVERVVLHLRHKHDKMD